VLNGITRGGRELAVEVTLVPLTRSARGHVLAVVENVASHLEPPLEPREPSASGERGERLYRAVFDQSYQATWVLSADGAVLAANRRARGIMCRDDAGLGMDALQVTFPRASQTSRASLAIALDAAQDGEPVRLVFDDVDSAGAPRVHEVTVRPALGDSGASLFLVLEARDVTEPRRREEELVAARLAAEAADRAKASFLARMSHEMRTPLHAVLGFTRLLGEPTDDLAARSEAVRQIAGAGEQLLALVEDVLEIARIEAGGLAANDAPANVRELLARVLAEQREAAVAKGLELAARIDPKLPTWLMLDDKRLRRALGDLLGHAVGVSRSGPITLEADWQPEGRRDRLALVVADQGPGLDPAEIAYLYSPFDRGDRLRSPSGSGLGLALARRLVLLMGGEFRVESISERGNRFRLELPAPPVEGLRESPAEPASGAQSASGAGITGLDALSAAQRDELERAARVADWQALATAIQAAASVLPELRLPLEAALDRFDYQAILASLATSRSESSASGAQEGRAGDAIGDASDSSSSTGNGRENK
jgi:PAS domain S-box-containing protein